MKIKYQFANETVDVEVTEEWGSILVELDRQEYNNNHKETRRHYSLDSSIYEGEDFAEDDAGLEALLNDDERKEQLISAIEALPPLQRDVIKAVYFDDITISEFAKRRGVAQPTISRAKAHAIKNLRKFF